MTPAECKLALQDNLNDSLRHALNLQQLLADERHALKLRDSGSLHETAAHKQVCVSELEALDAARGEICRNSGFASSPESMTDVIGWCNDAQAVSDQGLSQAWAQFLEVAEVCSGMNAANGSIIRVRQAQLNDALGILRAGTADTTTYGPQGHNVSELGSRSLAEA